MRRTPGRRVRRRTEARGRRRSGRSRGPCRQRGRCRPAVAMRIASAIASRRPATSVAPGAPARIAERIFAGSSLRGLSSVTITTSDKPHRDRAHFGPLALVAVAAGAEHGDQSPFDVRPQRADRGFERVGRVGIVDVDRNAGTADHRAFEPAADRRDPLHRREDAVEADSGRHDQSRRDQHVGGLIGADQRQGELEAAPVMLEQQRLAERSRGLVDQADGLASAADGQHRVARRAAPARSLLPTWDRRSTRPPACPAEAAPRTAASWLRNRLSIDVVVIEMVAGEIGEGRGGQRNALAAVLVEPVARRFVGDMGRAHPLEPGHVVEESDDVGRGQAGLDLVVRRGDPERPDRRRTMTASCARSGGSSRPSRSCRWSPSPRPRCPGKARNICRRARRTAAAARGRRDAARGRPRPRAGRRRLPLRDRRRRR